MPVLVYRRYSIARSQHGEPIGLRVKESFAADHESTRSLAEIRAIYAELGEQVRQGLLTAPVEKVYAIDEIKTAVAHAERGERAGKILVAPNGPTEGGSG